MMINLSIYLEELEERHHHGAVVALNLPQAVVEQADAEPVFH